MNILAIVLADLFHYCIKDWYTLLILSIISVPFFYTYLYCVLPRLVICVSCSHPILFGWWLLSTGFFLCKNLRSDLSCFSACHIMYACVSKVMLYMYMYNKCMWISFEELCAIKCCNIKSIDPQSNMVYHFTPVQIYSEKVINDMSYFVMSFITKSIAKDKTCLTLKHNWMWLFVSI